MAKKFVMIAIVETRANWTPKDLELLLPHKLSTGRGMPGIENVQACDVFDVGRVEEDIQRKRREQCGLETPSIEAPPQETI